MTTGTTGTHLISAAIVDAFIKARDDFSDPNTSVWQDIFHGLETIAPMILERAATSDLLAAADSCLNYAGLDAFLDGDLHPHEVWAIRREDLLKLRAAIAKATGDA